jgi:pyruvate formate-lyase/glycerol dehydratase family glycyl radical enzyme
MIMNQRINKLKRHLLVDERPLCIERIKYFTEAYRESEFEPEIIRRAKGMANFLDKITIFIEDGELIVGNVASKPMGVELQPVRGEWVSTDKLSDEEPFIYKKSLEGSVEGIGISKAELQELQPITEYWMRKVKSDYAHRMLSEKHYLAAESSVTIQGHGRRVGMGQGISGQGASTGMGLGGVYSFILDHEWHLRHGLNHIIEEAEQELKNIDFTRPDCAKKANFLRAVIICHKAAIRFAKRFSALASELASKEADPTRKKELERIASNCDWVPANPARDFWEALQSFWLVDLMCHPSHTGAPGRFDQYMHPYYKRDIEKGRITREGALELLCCLRVKHSELREIFEPEMWRRGYPGAEMFQNIVLGGVDRDGRDVTNELSYLLLEAAKECPTPHPTLSIRVHEGTPDDFMMKALEVVRTGLGMPAFFGDKCYTDFWLYEGLPLEIARDWALAGCTYSNPPKFTGESTGSAICPAKVLEFALWDGWDPRIGKQVGPKTGAFESFESFDDLMRAFKEQFDYFMKITTDCENISLAIKFPLTSQPFLTPLMLPDSIKTGNDLEEGCAPVEVVEVDTVGMINAADSLAAIKKLVFDEKKITKKQLKDALATNWHGHEDIRQMCLAAPKYGNDDDYVDLIAREAYQLFVELAHSIPSVRGETQTLRKKTYTLPCAFSVGLHLAEGVFTGATPDGRCAGEPLADGSVSAMRGRDTNGPTALMKSAAKINQLPINGSLMNMKFHPSALKTNEDMKKLTNLIKTYLVDLEGKHVQFNVVDAETLRDAREHPENHRDLIVRVAGYSAYFVTLTKEIQEEIIQRSELSL